MKNSEWAPGVYEQFMESYYDFVTCVRTDGSYYGNGGAKCRKGAPATKRDLAKEKKKAAAGDKQAAKNVAKMEKSGVAASSTSATNKESKKGYTPKDAGGKTGVKAKFGKDAFGGKSSSFDEKALQERIDRVKNSKRSAADKKKMLARLETQKAQVATNKKFVEDVGKNLPKGHKLEVTGNGTVKMTFKTKAGDTVVSTYSPRMGYEFRVNGSLNAGGARGALESARAVRRQFDALVKSAPTGHIMKTSAYTDDGKGAARQKAYESVGFSKAKPGKDLYAVKQANGSLSPGKTGKSGKDAQQSQENDFDSMWFKEENMDDVWYKIIFGKEPKG